MSQRLLRRGSLLLAVLLAVSLLCGCDISALPTLETPTALPAVTQDTGLGELTLLSP